MYKLKISRLLALSVTTAISLTTTAAIADNDTQQGFGSPIIDAAEAGDVSKIQALISSGASVNERGEFGTTPLMRAVHNNNTDLVNLLLQNGANPNIGDVGGATAVSVAAREGHNEILAALVKKGANLNSVDSEGFTPLMRATLNGNPQAVQILVKGGAKVNLANSFGETALSQATRDGQTEISSLLKLNGADDSRKIMPAAAPAKEVEVATVKSKKPAPQQEMAKSDQADIVIDFTEGRFANSKLAQDYKPVTKQVAVVNQGPQYYAGSYYVPQKTDTLNSPENKLKPVELEQNIIEPQPVKIPAKPQAELNPAPIATPVPAVQPVPQATIQVQKAAARSLVNAPQFAAPAPKLAKADTQWLDGLRQIAKTAGSSYNISSDEMVPPPQNNTILDLGTFKSADFANKKIDFLKKSFPEVFAQLPIKAVTKNGAIGVSYQIHAGLVSSADANNICKQLVSSGVNCHPLDSKMHSQEDFNNYAGDAPKQPKANSVASTPAATTPVDNKNDLLGPAPSPKVEAHELSPVSSQPAVTASAPKAEPAPVSNNIAPATPDAEMAPLGSEAPKPAPIQVNNLNHVPQTKQAPVAIDDPKNQKNIPMMSNPLPVPLSETAANNQNLPPEVTAANVSASAARPVAQALANNQINDLQVNNITRVAEKPLAATALNDAQPLPAMAATISDDVTAKPAMIVLKKLAVASSSASQMADAATTAPQIDAQGNTLVKSAKTKTAKTSTASNVATYNPDPSLEIYPVNQSARYDSIQPAAGDDSNLPPPTPVTQTVTTTTTAPVPAPTPVTQAAPLTLAPTKVVVTAPTPAPTPVTTTTTTSVTTSTPPAPTPVSSLPPISEATKPVPAPETTPVAAPTPAPAPTPVAPAPAPVVEAAPAPAPAATTTQTTTEVKTEITAPQLNPAPAPVKKKKPARKHAVPAVGKGQPPKDLASGQPLAQGANGKFEVARPVKSAEISAVIPVSQQVWIKVGNFKNAALAHNFINDLRNKDASFANYRFLTSSAVGRSTVSSVNIGPFNGNDAAQAACANITQSGLNCGPTSIVKPRSRALLNEQALSAAQDYETSGGLWHIQLGTYDSHAEAEEKWADFLSRSKHLRTMKSDIFEANDKFRLRAGNYTSSGEADKLCDDLRTKGISCIIVKD